MLIFNCPPPAAAGRNRPKTNRLTGKKFPPLKPLHFLPARQNLRVKKISNTAIKKLFGLKILCVHIFSQKPKEQPCELNLAFAKLTEVAPSGLQRLGCNKISRSIKVEFTFIIHYFGKKQKSVQNFGRRRAPPQAGRGEKLVVYKLAERVGFEPTCL